MSYEARDYELRVFWSAEDGEYVGVCSEFPHLSGLGSTPDEAIREIVAVLESTLEWARDEKLPVPEPKNPRETAVA